MAWTKRDSPVLIGQQIAGTRLPVGDPCVIRVGSRLECYYTTAFPEQETAAIALAVSTNGTSWKPGLGVIKSVAKGLVYAGPPGVSVETACLVPILDGSCRLYGARYREDGSAIPPGNIFVVPGFWRQESATVVLAPTPNSRDASACYSPCVVWDEAQTQWVMLYAGHNWIDNGVPKGVSILAATSPDGLVWTKQGLVLAGGRDDDWWWRDGVSEPSLLIGPDGHWYLFFTGELDEGRAIGIACGLSPLGPFSVQNDPIIQPTRGKFDQTGCLAPSALYWKGKVWCWFHGQRVQDGEQSIGLATAPWPI